MDIHYICSPEYLRRVTEAMQRAAVAMRSLSDATSAATIGVDELRAALKRRRPPRALIVALRLGRKRKAPGR